jgi:TonB family protein
VEEHLHSCPLCSDAIEGLGGMKDDHLELSISEEPEMSSPGIMYAKDGASSSPGLRTSTHRINMRLRGRFNYDPSRRRKATRRGPFLGNLLIPAAASIIILMGIIAYFHFFFPDPHAMDMAEQKKIPVTIQEKELIKDAAETPVLTPDPEQTVIGGLMDDSEEDEIEEAMVPAATESNQAQENEIVQGILVEDKAVSAEADEEFSIARPEAVVMHAAEERAGGGVSDVPMIPAKNRAKGDQKKESPELVFTIIEQMPEFPGGIDSLNQFLTENLKYPVREEQIKDTAVLAQFIVNRKGKIKSIVILKSAGKVFDDEVIRVIKMMPDWIPGMQRGEPISVKYTLPVDFKLE